MMRLRRFAEEMGAIASCYIVQSQHGVIRIVGDRPCDVEMLRIFREEIQEEAIAILGASVVEIGLERERF